ncbi:MAG: copper chaperone PCu(A)C [Gemmatimonadota bacterium]
MRFRLPILLFVPLLLSACGGEGRPAEPDIRAVDPWARAMPLMEDAGRTASNSAVYLTLRNAGKAPDRLLGGRTPAAETVEVHQSRLVGDVMRMEKLDGLGLPPDSAVKLEPGSYHLMLMSLTRSLEEGEELELTLTFERSGDLILNVPVGRAGGD